MKNLNVCLLCILLFFSLQTFAVGTVADSLIVLENYNGRQVIVNANQKVKIWLHDKTEIDGSFGALNGDTLTVLTDSKEERILVGAIKKIKFYTSKKDNVLGWSLIALGIVGLFAGLILALLIIGYTGSTDVIIQAVLLPIAGIALIISGIKLKVRKFNLFKWKMRKNQ